MENEKLKTSDMLLAATLIYNNYLPDMVFDEAVQRFVFVFNLEDEVAKESVKFLMDKFWDGKTSVEPKRFHQIIRNLKGQMVKHGK